MYTYIKTEERALSCHGFGYVIPKCIFAVRFE
jgi:hypothetical protein